MATIDLAAAGKPQRASSDLPRLIGFGVLVVIGLVSWLMQLTQGLDVLGVGQAVAWGVYIAAFFLLAGSGSGLVILAALGELGAFPAMKGQRRPLLIGGVACFIAGGFMILMDIGKPERVMSMLFSPNFKSMFVWDFYSLALSVILAVVYLYGGRSKLLAGITALVAMAVVVVEGWILAVSAGGALWHSALIPVVFLMEGLIAGASLAVLVAWRPEVSRGARQILGWLLPLVLLFSVIEMVTVSYRGGEAAESLGLLVGGSLAPFYWGQLLLGIVVPFLLVVWGGKSRATMGVAAGLAIVGVFVAKLDLLVAGQAIPFVGAPVVYTPTIVEVGGIIGGLGLAAFLFVLSRFVIPFKAEA